MQAPKNAPSRSATPSSSDFIPGIVIHAGAGSLPRDIDPALAEDFRASLRSALKLGQQALAEGQAALDIVERVVRHLEEDPHFNAGRGSVYTANKDHELDASIMCGQTLACGAVAGVKTVKHPISLARKVMQDTRHVLLAGPGAEAFADLAGVERVANSYFDTPSRLKAYQKAKARYEKRATEQSPAADDEKKGTVGAAVLDQQGRLAAGTSTGGLTYKKHGRVGDSPIVGAGTYADKRSCALSCTGTGEEYIRHAIAHEVSAQMRIGGKSLKEAADHAIHKVLKAGDGGLVAIDARGNIAMPFNTQGMFRGAANLRGRFEIGIWGGLDDAPPMGGITVQG